MPVAACSAEDSNEDPRDVPYSGVHLARKPDADELLLCGVRYLRLRRGEDDTPDAATWHPDADV